MLWRINPLVGKPIELPALRQHPDQGDGISINLNIGGFKVFAYIHLLVMAVQIPFIAEAHKQGASLGFFDTGDTFGADLGWTGHRSGADFLELVDQ